MSSVDHAVANVREIILRGQELLQGVWSRDRAQELFEQAERASDTALAHELGDLSEALLGFSAYLSSFADSALQPKPAQLNQLLALLDAVREACDRLGGTASAQAVPDEAPALAPAVIFYGEDAESLADLALACAAVEWPVRQVFDATALGRELDAGRIIALVIEDRRLPEYLEFKRGLQQRGLKPPPFEVVARQDTFAARLAAVRAGADGFYLLPGARVALVGRLRQLNEDRRAPIRVLAVDDDASMLVFLASVLRHNGMEVQPHQSPIEAFAALAHFDPDVILLDLYMPEVSGLELLATIRTLPSQLLTPVILLSGDDAEDRRFDALDIGGDDYLTKPIRGRHLVSAVTQRARRGRLLQHQLQQVVHYRLDH